MPRLPKALPKYCKHRGTGQAVVTIEGRDIYLGKYGSRASRAEYDRLIGEYIAAGRSLPCEYVEDGLTLAELAIRFTKHAKTYYLKDGKPTSEQGEYRLALRIARKKYDKELARNFTPLKLKAVREKMLEGGLCRYTINRRIGRLVRMFKWAVAEGLVPVETYQALATVEGLKKGRSTAREAAPVRAVSLDDVEATLPHLPPIVADMVRVMMLTGARPNEMCIMRPCDIDRSDDVWIYTPSTHKTEHHDQERVIAIGPRAQGVLTAYLDREDSAFCFDPRESEKLRRIEQRRARKTKVQPSQKDRSKKKPKRKPGTHYTTESFRRAVHRAADLAGVEKWSPNRLRHLRATEVRSRFGLDHAQAVLGHATADTTQIYAELAQEKAAIVAREIG